MVAEQALFINLSGSRYQTNLQERRAVKSFLRRRRPSKLSKEEPLTRSLVVNTASKGAFQLHDVDTKEPTVILVERPLITNDAAADKQLQIFSRTGLSELSIQTIGQSADPFYSLPGAGCTWLPAILDYFLNGYAASQMPVNVELGQKVSTIRTFFSVTIGNPAVFHAIMAKARCDYDARFGQVTPAKLSPQVLYHRGQSLRSLSQQLKAVKVGYACISAIMLLMTLDTAYCDVQSLMSHRRGLKCIIDTTSLDRKRVYLPLLRGSYLDDEANYKRDSLSSWLEDEDLYEHVESFTSENIPAWSLVSTESISSSNVPNGGPLAYPKHPFSPKICTLIAQMPVGFRKIALRCTLSIDLLTILRRTSKIQNLLAKAESRCIEAEELKYLHKYHPESEFHEGFNCLRHLHTESATLEKCLCLALVAFTNMAFNIMQFGPLWQQLRQGLAQAVQEFSSSEIEKIEEDCLIWMMIIAAWSWEGRIGLEEPGKQVLRKMLTGYTRTRSWVWMERILRDFFWNEDLGKKWQRCWMQADDFESLQDRTDGGGDRMRTFG